MGCAERSVGVQTLDLARLLSGGGQSQGDSEPLFPVDERGFADLADVDFLVEGEEDYEG
jgi:hypothetical protein